MKKLKKKMKTLCDVLRLGGSGYNGEKFIFYK